MRAFDEREGGHGPEQVDTLRGYTGQGELGEATTKVDKKASGLEEARSTSDA